jgi:hypothetical protein
MNLDFGDGLFFGLGFLFAKGFVELLKIAFVMIFYEDKQD